MATFTLSNKALTFFALPDQLAAETLTLTAGTSISSVTFGAAGGDYFGPGLPVDGYPVQAPVSFANLTSGQKVTATYDYQGELSAGVTGILAAPPDTVSVSSTSPSQTTKVTLQGYTVAPIQSIIAVNATGKIVSGVGGYALVGQTTTLSHSAVVENIGAGNLAGTGTEYNLNGTVSGLGGFNGEGQFVSSGTYQSAYGVLTGPSSGSFSLQDMNASTGATTATYSYTYAPTTRGTSERQVQFTFLNGNNSGSNNPQLEYVTVYGVGVAPVQRVTETNAAGVGGSTNTGNLGYVLLGNNATATLTIQDVGDGDLAVDGGAGNLNGSISAVTGSGFTGDTTDSFSLRDGAQSTSLPDNYFEGTNYFGETIGSGQTTSYSYTYSPTQRGTSTTTATINFSNGSSDGLNNAQTLQFTFTGSGVAPVASVSGGGGAISRFNAQGYGSNAQAGTASVTIQNVGDGNLSGLGSVSNLNGSVTGANNGSFSLADGTSFVVNYVYAPTSRGQGSQTVDIALSDGSTDGTNRAQTAQTTISGQGVGPEYVSPGYYPTSDDANPDGNGAVIDTPAANAGTAGASTIDFGSVTVGETKTLLLAVQNLSNDPNGGNSALTNLTVVGVSESGGNDQGAFTASASSSPIGEGYTLYLPISVTPDQAGEIDTYLTVTTDEGAPLGMAGDTFTYELKAEASSSVACYLRGTLIETPDGEVPVESLAIGDQVVTASGARRPIKWIGRRSYGGRFVMGRKDILPICFKSGSLDGELPKRDLWISPHHAMYFERASCGGVLIEARDLVNGISIVQATQVDEVEYFHVELDSHDVILAEGAKSETFIDDDSRNMFHNAHEYGALYPDGMVQPARYYAPRLASGDDVEAIRRDIGLRAGISEAPGVGRLRGYVDRVAPDRICGWAQNPDHPDVPVCLAIFVDGRQVGQVLADQYRKDLKQGGFGSGFHGFKFVMPPGLSVTPDGVDVRRSLDGAALRLTRRARVAAVPAR